MLAKLAVRNVRRSARDYEVFFATVALGVAMFYAFNAIKSQAVLYDAMTVNSLRMLELLDMMMGIFSVAVACVLGFWSCTRTALSSSGASVSSACTSCWAWGRHV